jgi:16S rRNA (guanine966-N2)-methyltransferase
MRVIAGALGGRVLAAPRGLGTRPTSDRVREALFAVLGDVEGASVLDLYAGSGALAIEALSRGAARALCVERERRAVDALRRNLDALGLADRCTVLAVPLARARAAVARAAPFDLVLCDPPYDDVDSGLLAREIDRLLASGLLPEGGRLVLEHATRTPPPELAGLGLEKTRRYGDTTLSFYERAASAAGT